MKLNVEDSGNRKFILCTNNENNICRNVTYERIKRVIDKEGYSASLILITLKIRQQEKSRKSLSKGQMHLVNLKLILNL